MIVFTSRYIRKISLFPSVRETSFATRERRIASGELTWKALFVARRQKCGGRRDGWRRVPGGHNVRLHPVARRKLQDLLLLLAASPPTAARRERFHGRQEADPAHVFPTRFRFRFGSRHTRRSVADQLSPRSTTRVRAMGESGAPKRYFGRKSIGGREDRETNCRLDQTADSLIHVEAMAGELRKEYIFFSMIKFQTINVT